MISCGARQVLTTAFGLDHWEIDVLSCYDYTCFEDCVNRVCSSVVSQWRGIGEGCTGCKSEPRQSASLKISCRMYPTLDLYNHIGRHLQSGLH